MLAWATAALVAPPPPPAMIRAVALSATKAAAPAAGILSVPARAPTAMLSTSPAVRKKRPADVAPLPVRAKLEPPCAPKASMT